ncbi:MAG: hypothetical protein R3B06_23285 [Kofleriaceae bacterium]
MRTWWQVVATALVFGCGSGGSWSDRDASASVDAAIDAPALPQFQFVTSEMRLPTTHAEASEFAVDVDGDATNDNQMALFMVSFRSLTNDAITSMSSTLVSRGELVLLVDLRTEGLVGVTGPATVWIGPGTNPRPAPCSIPSCGAHLTGTGVFDVTPTTPPLQGTIDDGRVVVGPGRFVLPYPIGDRVVFLPIRRGRLDLAEVTPAGYLAPSRGGGAITHRDVEAILHPAFQEASMAKVVAVCGVNRTPPMCGCPPGSAGGQLIGLFDVNNDCTITIPEVTTTVNGLMTDDIDIDGDGVLDAVSVGFGLSAVRATFALP